MKNREFNEKVGNFGKFGKKFEKYSSKKLVVKVTST